MTINSPATLNISGGSVIVQGSLAGNVGDDSTLDIAPAQSFDYAGDISGNGSLTKDGPVSLTLSGSDTYTGGTTIDDGTLYVASSTALPSGTSLIVGAGGTFLFDPAEAGTPGEAASGEVLSGALTVTPVPEPGTWALLIAGAATLALYHRRRCSCAGLKTVAACRTSVPPDQITARMAGSSACRAEAPLPCRILLPLKLAGIMDGATANLFHD